MYEALTGKPYYEMKTEDDVCHLMYCCFIVSNPDIVISYTVFQNMLKDKRVLRWIKNQYELIGNFDMQFKREVEESEEEQKDDDGTEPPTASEIATSLIVRYGLDVNYVMKEMEMWELVPFFKEIENKKKDDLREKRLWTYLQVAPNIDTKKVKSPEKFLPFAWEKGEKQASAQKDLEKNAEKIKSIIGRKLF